MKNDVAVRGVSGVPVGMPIRGMAMDLDIPGEDPPIGPGEGSPQKVRPRPVVPDAGVMKPDRLARHRRQRIPNQLLKPDPLKDGLRQDRPRLFPEKIRADPSAVPQTHKEKTSKPGKGCGLF